MEIEQHENLLQHTRNRCRQDPHWSNNWVQPDECAHLAEVIIMVELSANGLQNVNKIN